LTNLGNKNVSGKTIITSLAPNKIYENIKAPLNLLLAENDGSPVLTQIFNCFSTNFSRFASNI
jgi:hypothetical protein